MLGEGQAMVFLTPEEALARDLGVTAAILVPRFLASASTGPWPGATAL